MNVASRVTAVAPPWAVYAEESARRAIGDAPGIAWQEIGAGKKLLEKCHRWLGRLLLPVSSDATTEKEQQ